jgi:hypothetical protein
MPIIEDFTSAQSARVTTGQGAMRVADYPMDCLSYVSVGAQTGNITGLAANSALFSLRNLSANPIAVRSIGIGFALTTAFTTAQLVSFGLTFARGMTTSDTGGTAIAFTSNNAKARTSLGSLTSVDCRVAAASALTAGTKVLDANTLGQTGGWAAGVGTIIPTARDNLYQHNPGDYPIILAQNEGINVMNLTLMGAAGVGVAFINLEVAEMASYQG